MRAARGAHGVAIVIGPAFVAAPAHLLVYLPMSESLLPTFGAFVLGALAGLATMHVVLRARTAAAVATAVAEVRVGEATARSEVEAARRQGAALEQRLAEQRGETDALQAELRALREQNTRLRTEESAHATRLEELRLAQERLAETFKALSGDALARNNEAFLRLARAELERASTGAKADLEQRQQAIVSLVAPIREGLSRYDQKLAEIEQERTRTFGALTQRLEQVMLASDSLKGETQKLVQALRAPAVRGRWGEVQLRRVVELAGMLEHCDFTVQESVDAEQGRLRPDLTVRLPNGKTIVVDSKAPLLAYLEATEASDDAARRDCLLRHARQIRTHVDQLSRKNYWDQFGDASPEFVVLFLPGEVFFSAALEHDPSLIEQSVDQRVILATPTTLIALLKAVAFGWRQERITRNAQEISQLGKELYERLCVLGAHVEDVGQGLSRAVGAYNKAVGSMESRVLVAARRFTELGVGSAKELGEVPLVESSVRAIQTPDLMLAPGAEAEALPA